MPVKVKITGDNFFIGLTKIKKGEIITTSEGGAKYMEANGSGKIVKPKRTYKRRDMTAETG